MSSENPTYRAIEKYKKKTYDRIELLVYKGEKKRIRDFAEQRGKSVNSFITDLIREEMKKSGEPLSKDK